MMPAQQIAYVPSDISTIRTMNKIAKILALIFGIIFIIVGIVTILFIVGILPLIWGIVNLIIYSKINTINLLVDQQRYVDAKNKTLVWMIIGFIFAGVIVGVLLLISYLKYDDVIRAIQQNYSQQNNQGIPPQQPPTL
ncbi:MAG: hypothetical protein ACP5NL_02610 [Thermoplasmata archaeon]